MKVIIWVFILSAVVFSCSEEKIQPIVDQSSVKGEIPSHESWNSKMTFTDEGKIKAVLFSNNLKRFEMQRISLLEGVKVNFYDSSQKNTSWLTSLRGKRDDSNGNMYAIDNVVAKNDSGVVLTTTELMWRSKDQKIVTDKFVTITSPKEIIQGYGFESDQHLSNYVIFNPTYSSAMTTEKK